MDKNKIAFELVGDSDAVIVTHKHIIVTILVNLIKNARESIQKMDGHAREIKITVTSGQAGVSIAVRDTGMGASKETQKRIFERGFTTKANGHGIGLAGCRYNMIRLGGQLSLSREGVGLGATVELFHPWDSSATEHSN